MKILKIILGSVPSLLLSMSMVTYARAPLVPTIEVGKIVIVPTVEEIIEKHLGQPEIMKEIAWCESRYKPSATGKLGEYGVFQILPSTWENFKCIGDPYNASDNAVCAEKIRQDSLYHWACYSP